MAQYEFSSSGEYSSGSPRSVQVLFAEVPLEEVYVGRIIGIVGIGGGMVIVVLALYAMGVFGVASGMGLGVWNEMTVNSASSFVEGVEIGSAEEVVEWTKVYTRISED